MAETLFNDNPHRVNYATMPTAVFGLPEIGAVGLTEERARDARPRRGLPTTSFRPMLHTLTGEQVGR